jgi:hypothetical protein
MAKSTFEQGEIGPDLFRKACEFGLEGLVSKRRDSSYRSGRSPSWIKVKNRSHPAMERSRSRSLNRPRRTKAVKASLYILKQASHVPL